MCSGVTGRSVGALTTHHKYFLLTVIQLDCAVHSPGDVWLTCSMPWLLQLVSAPEVQVAAPQAAQPQAVAEGPGVDEDLQVSCSRGRCSRAAVGPWCTLGCGRLQGACPWHACNAGFSHTMHCIKLCSCLTSPIC